jgi:hypothetical protein
VVPGEGGLDDDCNPQDLDVVAGEPSAHEEPTGCSSAGSLFGPGRVLLAVGWLVTRRRRGLARS